MNRKRKRVFQRQATQVMIHMSKALAHNDFKELWNDIVILESEKHEPKNNKYALIIIIIEMFNVE